MDSFPRISSKDYSKLIELGYLLMEVLSAKEDGDALTDLDITHGISPIVEKLPHGLQERWIFHGSKYKNENNPCFPPFSFFSKFICNEARTRNDLSLLIVAAVDLREASTQP